MSLGDKYALVTGGSLGLGYAIAEAFVKEGASVCITGRDESALEDARARLSCFLVGSARLHVVTCDVSDSKATDELVKRVLGKEGFPHLDILVNNAGIYGPIGLLEENDWDEWVYALKVNLFGTVYMCKALLPHFKKRNYGKIINLSGGGATSPLPSLSSYAASKAAVVRFTETIAGELSGYKVDINSVAPGALNTRLLDEIISAGPAKTGKEFYDKMLKIKADGGVPLGKGTSLAVFLASSKSDGITGKLISAAWDPWAVLPEKLDELRSTDIYTLRRIVPEDRGRNWGDE